MDWLISDFRVPIFDFCSSPVDPPVFVARLLIPRSSFFHLSSSIDSPDVRS
jgi:hypothetical protein